MILKTKLSMGIGFLFLVIFALAGLCSYFVQSLSRESDNILKDNYDSIVYAKNMLMALDDMNTSAIGGSLIQSEDDQVPDYHSKQFEAAKVDFDKNLAAEKNNITEINEQEYVETLDKTYDLYLGLHSRIIKPSSGRTVVYTELLPAYEKLRQTISNISDINMQAVVRKNQGSQNHSKTIIINMAAVVAVCLLLAFGYFWYFPFYVSKSFSYLADKMRELLGKLGITLDTKSNDETHVILQSINLLENKYCAKEDRKET